MFAEIAQARERFARPRDGVHAEDADLAAAIEANRDAIAKEVLATSIAFGGAGGANANRIEDRPVEALVPGDLIEVRPGDVIHLPAGTLHAMLCGVMLLEVQEPSDSTFRVYDHDRLGLSGRPRELHIDRALESLRLNGHAPALIEPRREPCAWGERELLIDFAPYRVERLTLRRPMAWRPDPDCPAVLVVISGELEFAAGPAEGRDGALRLGETIIVPPAARMTLAPVGECQIVVAHPRRPAASA